MLLAEEFPLYDGETPDFNPAFNQEPPHLAVYHPSPEHTTGQAIIVCPGGGYRNLSMEKCGHRPARWLASLGHLAIVLRYRLMPYHHPVQRNDAQQAIRQVRRRADQWGLRADGVGMLGFSAGGHLVASAATANPETTQPDLFPDFQMLLYPVISMAGEECHQASRTALLGDDPHPSLLKELSPERTISEKTPPAFICHAADDAIVPISNSIHYYEALCHAGIHAEMHLYPTGGHGFGMAKMHPWTHLAAEWLTGRSLQ